MAITGDDVSGNRDYFRHKLRAEKGRSDVLHAAESGQADFTLVDTRGREAFAFGHIPGAICAAPGDDLSRLAATLPRDKEIVTYCWGHD